MSSEPDPSSRQTLFDSGDPALYTFPTATSGPAGALPLEADRLRSMSSGALFGWTQNVAMGLKPERLTDDEFLIVSTLGGSRGPDGEPIALGYHTGHWELGLLVDAAAEEFRALGATPFAAHVSDPCDGRSNGTDAMLDSLPYRNDAAIVMRRLIRSLPTRAGVLGLATCDKGLPAMTMAIAGSPDLPGVIVPGGVTLLSHDAEDTAAVQTLSARFARGEITLEHASVMGCRACGSAGGGCQFMGTAATTQVVVEALGLTLPHSALHPSGTDLWLDMARRSAQALVASAERGDRTGSVLTDDSVHNAMVVHAAVGGSTNLYLHLPAIAHAAGLDRPGVDDWRRVNAAVPRLVDALPNGPCNFATVHVFLDGIDPDQVIRRLDDPLPGTVSIVGGSLAPGGAIVKSTAIRPDLLDPDGVYRATGRARVFTDEASAIDAIKRRAVGPGEVIVLTGVGPSFGMPETYQVTAALKHVDDGGLIPLVTDGRFSGVSTGPCIGHVTPEAAAGGPIGAVRDGDLIRIEIDTVRLVGRVDADASADTVPAQRGELPGLSSSRRSLPDDTRLWAALQACGGGSWGGCVYDVDAIIAALGAGASSDAPLR